MKKGRRKATRFGSYEDVPLLNLAIAAITMTEFKGVGRMCRSPQAYHSVGVRLLMAENDCIRHEFNHTGQRHLDSGLLTANMLQKSR